MSTDHFYARVAKILDEEFDLECTEIHPLGRQHNSHSFVVKLPLPTPKPCYQKHPVPGTVAIPEGTMSLVVRMPHEDPSVDNSTRLENEVATMSISRPALCIDGVQLVPEVYGWSKGDAWMIEEFKEGVDLQNTFGDLSDDEKRTVLRQLALIVQRFQVCELPRSFYGYGGAGFDGQGNVVSTAVSLGFGGPFKTMREYYEGMLRSQLEKADSSKILQGWRSEGLRERLERFCNDGGIAKSISDEEHPKRTVVHGGLGLQNVVFDAKTLAVTGLLDFKLSHVASPVEEFLYSFHDIGGILAGAYGETPDQLALRQAILHGFPASLPRTEGSNGSVLKFGETRHVQWETAKIWDSELEKGRGLEAKDNPGSPGDIKPPLDPARSLPILRSPIKMVVLKDGRATVTKQAQFQAAGGAISG